MREVASRDVGESSDEPRTGERETVRSSEDEASKTRAGEGGA